MLWLFIYCKKASISESDIKFVKFLYIVWVLRLCGWNMCCNRHKPKKIIDHILLWICKMFIYIFFKRKCFCLCSKFLSEAAELFKSSKPIWTYVSFFSRSFIDLSTFLFVLSYLCVHGFLSVQSAHHFSLKVIGLAPGPAIK